MTNTIDTKKLWMCKGGERGKRIDCRSNELFPPLLMGRSRRVWSKRQSGPFHQATKSVVREIKSIEIVGLGRRVGRRALRSSIVYMLDAITSVDIVQQDTITQRSRITRVEDDTGAIALRIRSIILKRQGNSSKLRLAFEDVFDFSASDVPLHHHISAPVTRVFPDRHVLSSSLFTSRWARCFRG